MFRSEIPAKPVVVFAGEHIGKTPRLWHTRLGEEAERLPSRESPSPLGLFLCLAEGFNSLNQTCGGVTVSTPPLGPFIGGGAGSGLARMPEGTVRGPWVRGSDGANAAPVEN